MLKKTLWTLSFSALMVLANDPREVALELCEYSKKGNIEGMKEHASAAMIPQLDQIAMMLKTVQSTPEGRAKLEQGLKSVAAVNCKKSTTLTKNSDGTFKVTNSSTKQQYKLKKIDKDWKFVQ